VLSDRVERIAQTNSEAKEELEVDQGGRQVMGQPKINYKFSIAIQKRIDEAPQCEKRFPLEPSFGSTQIELIKG